MNYTRVFDRYGGKGGIRTLDTLLTYTRFPGERLQPLGHFSIISVEEHKILNIIALDKPNAQIDIVLFAHYN